MSTETAIIFDLLDSIRKPWQRLSGDQISEITGLSRARVQQLEERALLKLRCEFRKRGIEADEVLPAPRHADAKKKTPGD